MLIKVTEFGFNFNMKTSEYLIVLFVIQHNNNDYCRIYCKSVV